MNNFRLELEFIPDHVAIEIEGITFTNCAFLKLLIDNQDLCSSQNFEAGLVVWDELKRSLKKSGRYLIFTCACGIADDGGWEGINIVHEKDRILWVFEHADKRYSFQFKYLEYLNEINKIELKLKEHSNVILEPRSVIFPEHWLISK
ncbi:hypothetical protein [Acinetobacter sp. WCHAc010052]|uniref:hypothetical protein n=1 Tax=Acinetobacter sp. WCHAc010052 TaxID=2004647 RepID=UPI000B3D4CE3|nr:hypothetical protein [Acinetobacter sp. WCHAc010052]AXY58810.1 hypothetical protein CDG61_01390 [Acinetobacter sp. WCHAc010052]